MASEIPILVPKLKCIIPKEAICDSWGLDFAERHFNEVKQEFEEAANYLVKKIEK